MNKNKLRKEIEAIHAVHGTSGTAVERILLLLDVVGQSEQLVCSHCEGKGEYIDTHPERYGLKTCQCKAN